MNFFDFLRLRQLDPMSVVRAGEMAAPVGLLDPMSVVRAGELRGAMPQAATVPQVGINPLDLLDPMSVVREGEMPSMAQPVAGGLLGQLDPVSVVREPEVMELIRRLLAGR
jgi:hypothetical protein|tara:strand:+ start:3741 stop:4073 length:333 start_codon:yes stop_codon:yes gene_type:complete